MNIRQLTPEEWPLIEEILAREFKGDGLPRSPEQSFFLGAFEDDRLIGFVQLEKVVRITDMWVSESHRHEHLAEAMMAAADSTIPPGFVAMVLTDEPTMISLLTRMGGRNVGTWTVMRKDYS